MAVRPKVFLTVGMGRWPFDRLVGGIDHLCATHDVRAQIGTSQIRPACPHDEFLAYGDFVEHLRWADVIVTHAGNTVRVVQRDGRVPIAVAREHARGEMGNDHQVHFLRQEEDGGRVVAVWDVDRLATAVAEHADTERRLLDERPLPSPTPPDQLIATMDRVCDRLLAGKARRR